METQRLLMEPHDHIIGGNRRPRLSISEARADIESFRKVQNFSAHMLEYFLHKHLKVKDYVIVLQHVGHFAHKLQRISNSC